MSLLRRSQDERRSLEARFLALSEGLAATNSPAEKNALMIEFLALITPKERLAGDAAAFERFMGLDCVTERYLRVLDRKYMREEILVKTVASLVPRVLVAIEREAREPEETGPFEASIESAAAGAAERARALFRDLGIEPFLLGQVRDARRWQNRVTAFRALGKLAAALPAGERARLFSIETSNLLLRCCLDQDENVWIQRGALELLCELSPREALCVLERRLLFSDPSPRDDFFVRGFAVSLLPKVTLEPQWVETLRRLLRRPERSEYVRMQVARTLGTARSPEAERMLTEMICGEGDRRDPSPRVRAEATIEWRKKAERDPSREEIAARILAWLIRRDDAFLARRIALEEAAALSLVRQKRGRKFKVDRIDHVLLEAMDEVARRDPDIAIRRLAEEAREAIVVRNLAAFDWVEGRVAAPLAELDEWSDLRISRRDFAVPEELFGRILATFTRDDFGLVVERRREEYVIKKGDRTRRRLWRILHEIRNLDTAKRQAFRHTTGRVFRGELRIHSGILAELMETKVPGERLWNEAEQSWRRFLPLVDDYLSLFSWLPWRRQRTAKIFSSQGVTEIRDCNGFWRGLFRYLKMSWNYAYLAGQRNAHERNKVFSDPSKFVRIMREEYGIETRFRPAEYQYEGRSYVLDDPSLALHFRYGIAPEAERAAAEEAARAAATAEETRAAEEATPVAAPKEEATPLAPEDGAAPVAAEDRDSIDALLRPLEELARAEGWFPGSESGTPLAAAATSGMASAPAGLSGSTGDLDDTNDEIFAPLAAKPAPEKPAPPFAGDETLPEIAAFSAPVGAKPAPPPPRSEPEIAPNGLDASTADMARTPDAAGEITQSGSAAPVEGGPP
jgi:hypothetical protein